MGRDLGPGNRSPSSGNAKTSVVEPQPAKQPGVHSFIHLTDIIEQSLCWIWCFIGTDGEQYGLCPREGKSKQAAGVKTLGETDGSL